MLQYRHPFEGQSNLMMRQVASLLGFFVWAMCLTVLENVLESVLEKVMM